MHVRSLKSIELHARPWRIAFSRDGQLLAVTSNEGVSIFETLHWKRLCVEHVATSCVVAVEGSIPFATDAHSITGAAKKYVSVLPAALLRGGVTDLAVDEAGQIIAASAATAFRLHTRTDATPVLDYELGLTPSGQQRYGGEIVGGWRGFVGGFGYVNYYPSATPTKPSTLSDGNQFFTFAYASQAKNVYGGDGSGGVEIWRSPTDTPRRICKLSTQRVSTIAVSADGKWVALGYKVDWKRHRRSDRNRLVLVDGTTGKALWSSLDTQGVESLSFNSSGSLLAESDRGGLLKVFQIRR